MNDDKSFSAWLRDQIQQRNWSQSDLARAAGLSPAAISKMLNSKIKYPDSDSCLGLARALGVDPRTVFRATKLLPTEPEIPELDDLMYIMEQLSEQDRQEILAIAKVLFEINRKGYVIVE